MNRYDIIMGKKPVKKKYSIPSGWPMPEIQTQMPLPGTIIDQESLAMLQQISEATASIERERDLSNRNYQELNFNPGEYLTIRMVFTEHNRQQTMANRIDMFVQRDPEYRNMFIRDVRNRMLRAILDRFENSNTIPQINITYEIY